MSGNKKIEEGLEHIKNAEKSLKTSLLKWRPDYENAADEYNKAATCFRNAKAFEQCKDCLLKAVECHKQNRALFYAAKALDQCVLICKELGDLREVASLAERAANMFQSHGSAESAASSLDKAAKILESQHPADALKLFQHAAEISMVQDSSRQAAEYTSKVARLHVKLQQYDLAADAIRRELGLHQQSESYQATGRLTVALVLVQLARGDVVAAEKAFKEWGNYCEGPEVQTLETLLQAYDEEDPENAKRALNSPFIKHMDVEYAILARDMPLPEGLPVPPKASVRENAAPSYESPISQTEKGNSRPNEVGDSEQQDKTEKSETNEDDEYAGGLC
ncbi:gamma-soluble NSF attachment protein-like [Anoplophora glabripennis]|uniref:gamma-soluble NSF attachment protein-like n=1 Tax=Anoplophora glabripennis TaxID=217634 RepID=UPI00087439EA|nr:gamma-soluble NSF attachment protein-like [Anoplophora glabripennis]